LACHRTTPVQWDWCSTSAPGLWSQFHFKVDPCFEMVRSPLDQAAIHPTWLQACGFTNATDSTTWTDASNLDRAPHSGYNRRWAPRPAPRQTSNPRLAGTAPRPQPTVGNTESDNVSPVSTHPYGPTPLLEGVITPQPARKRRRRSGSVRQAQAGSTNP
jgi:hypothetical protein